MQSGNVARQGSRIGITLIDNYGNPTQVDFSSLEIPHQLEVLFASQQDVMQETKYVVTAMEEINKKQESIHRKNVK